MSEAVFLAIGYSKIVPAGETLFTLSSLFYLCGFPIVVGAMSSATYLQEKAQMVEMQSIKAALKFNGVLRQIEESVLILNNNVFEYANDHFLAKFDSLIRELQPVEEE